MVLAAGLGTRMRPLTDTTAKPLLHLGWRPLLDHALDHLVAAGVETVAVNAHWQADAVAAIWRSGLAARGRCCCGKRPAGDRGRRAGRLAVLGHPFFVVNGDAFWLNGPISALQRLAAAFTDDVDAVLLVHRTSHVHADVGFGDFALDKWGSAAPPRGARGRPYIYAGVQLIHPRLLAERAGGRLQHEPRLGRALAAGRLRAVVHDGIWFHLSTPPDLAEAEQILEARFTGDARWPWR